VSGEANVWPFYAGVITDPTVIAPALAYLDARASATRPLALRDVAGGRSARSG
jgi:hypothetical protein